MIVIRETRLEDIDKIYTLLNQSYVKKYFKHREEEERKKYQKWYRDLINSSNCVMFTLEDRENRFLGSVKFLIDERYQEAEIFIYLDKSIRGNHHSVDIINLSIEEIKFKLPTLKNIVAHILEENEISIHCFEKAGFRFVKNQLYNGIDYSLYSKQI